MTKFASIAHSTVALACAIVVSAAMVFGTVAPVHPGAPTQFARAIA